MLDPYCPYFETNCRRNPLVLVVDDCEDNLIFAGRTLELLSYEYLVASGAKIALDLARDKLPDLILLDIVMPKVDGITLIGKLKKNILTREIPIIAVTGLAFESQKKQILTAGCDDYLCKPYLIEDLEEKLNLFLDCNLSIKCIDSCAKALAI